MSAGDLSAQATVSCDNSSRNCASVISCPSVAIEAPDFVANGDDPASAGNIPLTPSQYVVVRACDCTPCNLLSSNASRWCARGALVKAAFDIERPSARKG